jgi:HAE1 family hydrophobic/amphiphilic exporter-1
MFERNYNLTKKFGAVALLLLLCAAVSPDVVTAQQHDVSAATAASKPAPDAKPAAPSTAWGSVLPAPAAPTSNVKQADAATTTKEAATKTTDEASDVEPPTVAAVSALTPTATNVSVAPARVELAAQQTGTQTSAPVVTAPSANTPPQGVQPPQVAPVTPTASTPQSGQPQGSNVPSGQAPLPAPPPASVQPRTTPQGSNVPSSPPTTGAEITAPAGVAVPGRESVPAAAPAQLPLEVPPVATDFRAPLAPFPLLQRVGVEMGDQRPLALREAIEMALANNKDIEVARQNVRVAEFDLQGARGVYDPRLSSFSYYDKTETPSASFLSGTTSGSLTQSGFFNTATLQGLTPKAGGGYRVDFSGSRVTSNSLFASLDPQYPSALTFSYTQPLLRGRSFDQNRRFIEIAKRNLSLTDAQFRQRAIETITNVQRSYWDLVFALRNLQIQRDAVRDARTQLEHNRRLVAEGMLAPIDVVAAEAQVSGFEQSVYSALDDVGRAENTLKNLIAENRQSSLWNVALVPVDQVDLQTPPVALPEALNAALANRPELRQSDVAREINEIEQRFAREQTKTQVDLVGSYGLVGLAGSVSDSANAANPLTASNAILRERINQLSALNGLPPLDPAPAAGVPDIFVGGVARSFTNLAANRFNNFRVGVQINLPFKNRTARAQLGRTLVEQERIATQREQLEQLIQVDVRNALQLVQTAESRLRAAAVARNASEQQYASEQRKFDVGQSTFFLVLERQTALTTARGNELRAQTELNKAVAELQRATGNALEANKVEVRLR